MGLFSNLMSKIFGTASSAAASQPSSAPASAGSGGATVDVAAVLDGLAAKIQKSWIGKIPSSI